MVGTGAVLMEGVGAESLGSGSGAEGSADAEPSGAPPSSAGMPASCAGMLGTVDAMPLVELEPAAFAELDPVMDGCELLPPLLVGWDIVAEPDNVLEGVPEVCELDA